MKSSEEEDLKTQVIPATAASPGGDDGVGVCEALESLPVKPQERYRFIRSIGFGGMKSVLLVRDADTGREVAMAIMPDFRERPRRDLERFVREARLTAKLEHPNIVPVHDLGIDRSGSPYFTMKYLHGQSLASVLRRLRKNDPEAVERFNLVRLLQIFIRICNAIEFAHSRGVGHFDLKPENVNIGEFGEVVVLDWGLARRFEQDDSDGRNKGTPGYMAPELISAGGPPADARSDIYSLGGILYAMLALTNPLSRLPVEEVLRRTVTGEVIPPSDAAPEGRYVPGALEAICMKAMALQPGQRYGSVSELREDIFAFQTGYAPKAENASPLKHAGLFIGRNMFIVLILLTLLLASALLYIYFRYWQLSQLFENAGV